MNFIIRTGLSIVLLLSLVSLKSRREISPEAIIRFQNIIPKPVSAIQDNSSFFITKKTNIVIEPYSDELRIIGNYISGKLIPATGFSLQLKEGHGIPKTRAIYLTTVGADEKLGEEGYELTISKNAIKIVAYAPAGLFRGVQTLRQLLPEKIELSTKQDERWEVAGGTIRDYPQYSWRGSMLDVSRHFFQVEDVKRYIDLLAYYKMNVLHLHLSDDQGWRIEIKTWPDLTVRGSTSQVGGGAGGFYTQEQYRDIVTYAQNRYVTVIPEVDLPGHINAALVAYGELNCDGKPKEIFTGTKVGFSSLCNNEASFRFVNDVVRELSMITPGPYIHIGGDEAAATKKEDYIVFINKFYGIVKSYGKQMIGWEEIAQASIDEKAISQHWHSADLANASVAKGAKIISSPASRIYLDMKYDATTKLGTKWAGLTEVDKAYSWDPAAEIPGVDAARILGVEAPLWTESIQTMDDIEFMVFPRLPGVAEVGWTAVSARDWNMYKVRLGNHSKKMKAMDINFYRSAQVPWVD